MKKSILISIVLFVYFIHGQEKTIAKESIIIKGQIVDQEMKTGVAYATIILKKEEIYRVADENGYFKLPLKKYLLENLVVEISSMGYETKTIQLKKLKEAIYLQPKYEALSEVVITAYTSPEKVLKKAIASKKVNHPIEAFNFYRYGKVLINKNDVDELDVELISKDYDDGYTSPYVITQRVEHIKWNKNRNPAAYKHTGQFFSYRQNAIRYASILHKRKYKSFHLKFVKSRDSEQQNWYIISFQAKKNDWIYTNKSYPTKYSGLVYIDKNSLAILKVIETWETTLNEKKIKRYLSTTDANRRYQGFNYSDDLVELTIKEENICLYSNVLGDGKYYATKYYKSAYSEAVKSDRTSEINSYTRDSDLFDFEVKNVEEIEYYEFNDKKENALHRASYDQNFWRNFYKRCIGITSN